LLARLEALNRCFLNWCAAPVFGQFILPIIMRRANASDKMGQRWQGATRWWAPCIPGCELEVVGEQLRRKHVVHCSHLQHAIFTALCSTTQVRHLFFLNWKTLSRDAHVPRQNAKTHRPA
jgi:hypothetical protein